MIEVNYNEYKETIAQNMKLIVENHGLKQETEKLNKELETIKDNFDFNLGAIENIRKENHILEERIDKAIEYIRKREDKFFVPHFTGKETNELLDILKGDDKE